MGSTSTLMVDHSEYPCRCNSSSSVVIESSPSFALTSSIAYSDVSDICIDHIVRDPNHLFPFCLLCIYRLLRSSCSIFLGIGPSIPESVCICQCSGERTQQRDLIGRPEGSLMAKISIRRTESLVVTACRRSPTRGRSSESPHRGCIETYPCRHGLPEFTQDEKNCKLDNVVSVRYG